MMPVHSVRDWAHDEVEDTLKDVLLGEATMGLWGQMKFKKS